MLTLDQLRSNRDALFWTPARGRLGAPMASRSTSARCCTRSRSSYAAWSSRIAAMAGFVLSMPMRYIYRALLWQPPPRTMILGVLATCYVTALALRVVINSRTRWLRRARLAVQDAVRVLRRRAFHHLPAAVLERALLRHQVLRVAAEATRSRAASRRRAGAGSAAEDAALPAQPAFSLQHAQRDLDADPGQPEPHGEPCRHAAVGVPALYAGSGPDEEGDAAPGDRSARSLSRTPSGCASASACGWSTPSRSRPSMRWCRACCCSRSSRTRSNTRSRRASRAARSASKAARAAACWSSP